MAYRDTILADNPVNYWRLGELSGNAIDGLGAHNLAWSGSPTYGAGGALVNDANTAMIFNGVDSIAVKTVSNYRIEDSQGSIEAWFKTSSMEDLGIFSTSDESTTMYAFILYVYKGEVVFGGRTDLIKWDRVQTQGALLADNTWHHVVAMSDGSTYKCYIDGVQVTLSSISTSTDTGNPQGRWLNVIGRRDNIVIGGLKRTSIVTVFDGTIDEVAIYNYPLTPAQVLKHYNSGLDLLKKVSGVVTDSTGAPVARTVRGYDRSTGLLIDETISDVVTGSYELTDMTTSSEVQRIVLADDEAEGTIYNDIIDRIIPE